MSIGKKTLALLTAAAFGTGIVACQRGAEDKSASSQDSSSMNQAPRQGYTGPANPSTSSPPSSSSTNGMGQSQGGATGDNRTGSPGSTNPSNSQPQPQNQQQR